MLTMLGKKASRTTTVQEDENVAVLDPRKTQSPLFIKYVLQKVNTHSPPSTM